MNQQLAAIARQIKNREFDTARTALSAYLEVHPEDASAWYLLSYAAPDKKQQLAAVQRALKFAPENVSAQQRLKQLKASAKPQRSLRLPLFLGGLMLVLVAIVVVFLATRPPTTETGTLPTLVSLGQDATVIPSATHTTPTEVLALTETPSPLPEITETPTVQASLSSTLEVTEEPTTATSTVLPAQASQAAQVAVQPGGFEIFQTATALVQIGFPSTQFTPTSNSSAPLATATPNTPSAPIAPGQGVPLATSLNIGTGEMRVISVNRPGTAFITELGGNAVNPPAGQEWVVVEALLICASTDNCAPQTENLRIVSASGGSYSPAPNFNVPLLFNTNGYAMGQVWGYLGFLVPATETGLSLVLTQGGQSYTFGL